jgi:hypothetical protein
MAVTICYPTAGASVPGNGGFFAWGTVTADDSVSSANAQWSSASGDTVNGTAINPPPAPCNWAFEFAGVAVGPDITLNVVANSGTYPVTFKLLSHAK